MKTTIIFIPTWRCNLKCGYCDYRFKGGVLSTFKRKLRIGPELDWPVWLYLLNRFRPYHLELTGGEPLCYETLPDFMAHLPLDSTWAITSNTLGDVERIRWLNCKDWTASYHYHSDKKFFGNLKDLNNRGFTVRVTMVLTPDNPEKVKAAIKLVNNMGIGVNIHPLLKQGHEWGKHSAVWDEFKAMDNGSQVMFISQIPTKFIEQERTSPVQCYAGSDSFVLFPDGIIYRCFTMIPRGEPLGHIEDFVPLRKPEPCRTNCLFPCDVKLRKE